MNATVRVLPGGYLQREIESFLSPLSCWRAQAAHAAVEDYDEQIAFTAMLLLLRFAHTADTRWADMVGVQDTAISSA